MTKPIRISAIASRPHLLLAESRPTDTHHSLPFDCPIDVVRASGIFAARSPAAVAADDRYSAAAARGNIPSSLMQKSTWRALDSRSRCAAGHFFKRNSSAGACLVGYFGRHHPEIARRVVISENSRHRGSPTARSLRRPANCSRPSRRWPVIDRA